MNPPAASAPSPTVEEGRAQPEADVFAYRLQMLRSERQQSLQDVASAIGGTKAHIWSLETGRSANPSLSLMKALAQHFNVSTAYLIGEGPRRHRVGESELATDNLKLTKNVAELCEALRGVVRVADRKTVEFDRARAALIAAEQSTQQEPSA